jgi:hypothetical protein
MRLYRTLYTLDSRGISANSSRTIRIIIKKKIALIEKGKEVREIRGLRAAIINLNSG